MRNWLLAAFALLTTLACSSAPPQPGPTEAAIWGEVRLVPPEGAAPGGASAYGDRRLRHVERVDYSRPGFVVVYVAGPPPATEAKIEVVDGRVGTHLTPRHAALGAAGAVTVTNRSTAAQAISCPEAGIVRQLASGESLRFAVPLPGALTIHLLESPEERALLFAAPGAYSVVDAAGRFLLPGLSAGPTTLHAWHPRFPPVERKLDLARGQAHRIDLAIGAGLDKEHHATR